MTSFGERGGHLRSQAAAAALLVASVLLSMLAFQPPAARSASAPAAEFSAERARVHVEAIAQRPRPMGSPEHARVREYLVAELSRLGLVPELQQEMSVADYTTPFGPAYRPAAVVRNVLARLPGRSSDGAIVLMAHYDSVPAGPGANDNAVAVAALLETARALKASGQPLARDVLFLFTDGEETGLLGAKAFFEQHPLRHQLGVVLNFEARGSRGPVLMFETGPGSGWLVGELASAVPQVLASSLFDEAYRYLPNMTEFTLAKAAGLPGLNFAHIGGINDYHNALDRPENVDSRTVQHHGEYALRLAQRLGAGEWPRGHSTDRVFFNLPGPVLVSYPVTWSLPLAVGAVLLWAFAVALGLRRGLLRVSALAWGALAFLLHLVALLGVAVVLTLVAGATNDEFRRIGDSYDSGLYFLALMAFSVSGTATLVVLLRRRVGVRALAAGASAWWALLAVLTAALVPGVGFLVTWPLAGAALGLALLMGREAPRLTHWRLLAALALCAVPSLLIAAPLVYLTFLGLTLRLGALAVLLAGLLLGLLVPLLHELTRSHRWLLPSTASAVGAVLVAVASAPAAPTAARPRANNIIYALDVDGGQALWASSDAQLDEWSRQFLPGEVRQGPLPAFLPRWGRDFWYGPAPVLSAPPPVLKVLEDTVSGDRRAVRLRVTSPRGARSAMVFASGVPVLHYSVGGVAGPAPQEALPVVGEPPEWVLCLEALTPGGDELSVTVPASQPFTLRVVDRSDTLPELPGFAWVQRPPHMIPAASLDVENWGHSTYVGKAFHLGAAPGSPTADPAPR